MFHVRKIGTVKYEQGVSAVSAWNKQERIGILYQKQLRVSAGQD